MLIHFCIHFTTHCASNARTRSSFTRFVIVVVVVVFVVDSPENLVFGRSGARCGVPQWYVGGVKRLSVTVTAAGYLNSVLYSLLSVATLILAFGSSKLCARSSHVLERGIHVYALHSVDNYVYINIVYVRNIYAHVRFHWPRLVPSCATYYFCTVRILLWFVFINVVCLLRFSGRYDRDESQPQREQKWVHTYHFT